MASIVVELRQLRGLTNAGLKFMAKSAGIGALGYERSQLVSALLLSRVIDMQLADLQVLAKDLGVHTAEGWSTRSVAEHIVEALLLPHLYSGSATNVAQEEPSDKKFPRSNLSFHEGESAIRKGELCKIVSIDGDAGYCTVCMDKDGLLVDTLVELLRPACFAYPQKARDTDCPICLRPVSGENCVPCCERCEESKWLHRQCLLGLVCSIKCPGGHSLREADADGKSMKLFKCGACKVLATGASIRWHCPECNWNVCRGCIQNSVMSGVPCPTCRSTLPISGPRRDSQGAREVLVIDEAGLITQPTSTEMSVVALDCLFQ